MMATCKHIADQSSGLSSEIALNTKVYKDDCMYCFDTPENNASGLDICLQCFQSFSRGEINHTRKHYDDTGHSYYLNVVKVLKPDAERNQFPKNEEGERQQKIAKLEIKDTKEEDIYNIIKSVYCLDCDQSYSIEDSPENIQGLIENILKSNSSARDDEIKAWGQEVFPCAHSVDIEQFPNDSVDLSICAQCDLKENLWICLHCGIIGCGRQQFGSALQGNSHALTHYELSGHPVAVKLGSLSADDVNNCDCYCYQCQDEVKVNDLYEKLLKYGIDLAKSVKTEKNLIELNLDQNLNWEFKLDGANGEKLEPIFGKDLTGFQNLGNSCYLNSVLQALFSLPSYQKYFGKQEFPSYKEVQDPSKDLLSQLIKIHDGLLSGRYSKPNSIKGDDYQLGIKPSTFKSLIGENHPEFKTQKQQDSFEFLLYLLDKIDNELGLSLNRPLKFLMGSKVVCSKCLHGKISMELIDNVSVPIDDEIESIDQETGKKTYKETNIVDSFRNYCAEEAVEDFKCDSCDSGSSTAIKSTGFKTFPDVLVVNARRIKLENWVPVKVDVPISIPGSIDLSHFTAPLAASGETINSETENESDSKEFVPNAEGMSMLLSMGFPEVRCIKGLYNTGNNNAEDAMNWILAHMDDIDIDDPFTPSDNSASSTEPSQDSVDNLVAMGFSNQLSKKSLILNKNDINAAVEWLFSNPDDDGVIEDSKPIVNVAQECKELTQDLLDNPPSNDGRYDAKAVICHKGSSPHTGHYVVYIRKVINNELKWVLFNDEKVVACDDASISDIKENGYIYIFERIK